MNKNEGNRQLKETKECRNQKQKQKEKKTGKGKK